MTRLHLAAALALGLAGFGTPALAQDSTLITNASANSREVVERVTRGGWSHPLAVFAPTEHQNPTHLAERWMGPLRRSFCHEDVGYKGVHTDS